MSRGSLDSIPLSVIFFAARLHSSPIDQYAGIEPHEATPIGIYFECALQSFCL